MEATSAFSQNVRYQLAKQQLEQMFLKWISMDSNHDFLNSLIDEMQDPGDNIMKPPPPLFANKYAAPLSPSQKSTSNGIMSGGAFGESYPTPPRSPSGSKYGMTLKESQLERIERIEEDKDLGTRTLTPKEIESQLSKKQKIPKFYFIGGKPISIEQEEANIKVINDVFGDKDEINEEEFVPLTENLFKFPKFLNKITFEKVNTEGNQTIKRSELEQQWKDNYERIEVAKRMFNILKKSDNEHLVRDDFRPMLKELLETHPGLEFLKNTPEFQERYADTVIMRIYFEIDTNDDDKISYRDFRKSNLIATLKVVDEEDDINKIRDYFSYEHFYVLYWRFWELDSDHDFFIDKEDFSRYEGYALSRKTMDRIFEEIPRKFKSTEPNKMWYEDFVWFMLCEEDKTTK